MTDFEVIGVDQNQDGSLDDPDKTRDYSGSGAQRAFNYAGGVGALAAKWPILPVFRGVFRYFAASAFGAVAFPGATGRLYGAGSRGLCQGYREIEETPREAPNSSMPLLQDHE
jgi:hypothetical protein